MQIFGPELSIDFRPRPNTSPCALEGLARDCDPVVLEHIATNPKTPAAVLEILTTHAEAEVRAALAENKNTPLHCIWTLVKDEDPDVRYALAENHQLPIKVLQALTEDDNPYVACRAQRTISRLGSISQAPTESDWRQFRRTELSKRITQIRELQEGTPLTLLSKLMDSLYRCARAI